MPLLPDKLDEFVLATLKNFKKESWVDISLPFQEYYFAQLIARSGGDKKKGGKKKIEDGGHALNWKVQVKNTGSFKDSELFGIDNTHVTELLAEAEVPWTKQTVYFIYDVDEQVFQSGPTKIIDIIKVRRHSMYNDFFEAMEDRMWTAPSGPDQNPRRPYGIPYFLPASETAAFGFNGTAPSGWTTVAGLSPTTYQRWRSGTGCYGTIAEDDGLALLAEACEKTKFKPPHDYNMIGTTELRWGFYTTYTVFDIFGRLARQQNDNMGADVGKFRDRPLFKGVPMFWVPALSEPTSAAYNSRDPILGIDWNSFEFVFQKGRNQVVHKPQMAAYQHTVREVFMDNWGNFRHYDRRRGFHLQRKQ